MTFDEMIEEFNFYIPELKNFKSYLLSDSTTINTKLLGGIRTEHIIDSIDYHIEHNGYTSKSIASKYAIAIAQFYRYATSHNWFVNNDLLNQINLYRLSDLSYYYQIGTYIKANPKLNKKEGKVACTYAEINDIISTIDTYFEKSNGNIDQMSFSKVSSMLAVKLMILSGAKYKTIREIKNKDLLVDSAIIKVGEYQLRLPVNLSLQFRLYKEMLDKKFKKTPDFLFCNKNSRQWGAAIHSGIVDFLSVTILRMDTTGLTKYGITNLLKAGLSIVEIEKLTGAKGAIIRGCMPQGMEADLEKENRLINMKLANCEYYYKL